MLVWSVPLKTNSPRACGVLQAREFAKVTSAEEQVGAAERQCHGTLCGLLISIASPVTPARTARQRQHAVHKDIMLV